MTFLTDFADQAVILPLVLAVSIALGIGLAAATGFRVFLPLLITSIATYAGYIPVSDGFSWIGTPAAVIMLSIAALAEVLAYYIPGVDNLLDTIATPAALIAGTVVSAAVMAASMVSRSRISPTRITSGS